MILRSKKSRRAREANPEERAAFGKKQMTLPARRLWFLDEFGIHLAMARANARAPRGERAVVVEPFETGGNISVIGAITLDGVQAPMMIEGPIDGEVLELYVKHFLSPQLRPGDIVIWDNVPTHKSARVLALIEATGARVEPLPAYSPDFNPKEECISKVKAELKRVKVNTKRKLKNALHRAYAKVTLSDISGWFRHCGYAI
ncbi:MAG: IS630 family transposase [Acidobacteriota bacterium]|nr:MAG: IS630 family transposase [Acidobacteriota bacterium]